MRHWLLTLSIVMALQNAVMSHAYAVQPIISDSRIKTFVYNENDVYTLTTHYGYQSNIEFAKNERIETVSLGDRIAWQIVPAGRRLFVRPQEEGVSTNMTVITNKRSYQFDLRAEAGDLKPNAQIAYVVRFYYPTDDVMGAMTPPVAIAPMVSSSSVMPPASMMPMSVPPVISSPQQTFNAVPLAPAAPEIAVNLNYTYTGPDDIAPLKVFDNGKATFFRFQNYKGQKIPALSIPSKTGVALPVQLRPVKDGYWAVPIVTKQFQMRYKGAGNIVTIYNEGS